MTQDYPKPIAPPPELVEQWASEWLRSKAALPASHIRDNFMTTRAAQWGADQELEACCHYFARDLRESLALELRDARRPKPPSLKEQALAELAVLETAGACYAKTIRRALEQLDD